MSALAQYYKKNGLSVSGSDSGGGGPILSLLRKEGIKVKIGPQKGLGNGHIERIIVSQAIPRNNQEYQEGRRCNIPILTYPEAIGELTRAHSTIAVAGAHGKSTTTALVSLMLVRAGLDPTVILGVTLREFGNKNFRPGSSSLLVLEADEFGNAFSYYTPTVAVLTNIDREHLDTYKNLANIKKAFLQFVKNITPGGVLIANKDDRPTRSLTAQLENITRDHRVRLVWYSTKNSYSKKIKKILKIAGKHNLSNACAVFVLAKILGISQKKTLQALGSYQGAWRRLEYKGTARIAHKSFEIFDDYAHHPTEIRATLQALKEMHPRKPVLCVFQPHQAKRLQALFREFSGAFSDASTTVILPTYIVPGRDDTHSPFTAERLARKIGCYYFNPSQRLKSFLAEIILHKPQYKTGGRIVMMGAGSIAEFTREIFIR